MEAGNIYCDEVYLSDSWVAGYSMTDMLKELYAGLGSDYRLKNSIQELNENMINFIYHIKPCSYKYNDYHNDKSTHFGFIAQDIKNELEKNGLSDVIYTMYDSGKLKGYYGIAYTELIAPIVGALQQINKRVEKLEGNQWMQI